MNQVVTMFRVTVLKSVVELFKVIHFVHFQRCDRCGQSGATVGCCLATCQSNFHFMCARAQNCVFQQDRKVYCYKHRDLVSGKVFKISSFFTLCVLFIRVLIVLYCSLHECLEETFFSLFRCSHT